MGPSCNKMSFCKITCFYSILLALSFQLILTLLLRKFAKQTNLDQDVQFVIIDEILKPNPILFQESVLDTNTSCVSGTPCGYPETVDFRIIVITFNRALSLLKLLRTLNTVLLDGDVGRLEIWIDRDKSGKVDANTLEIAQRFRWSQGITRVHVQDKHVGIYGQWIDTWTPPADPRSRELALILEDDLSVSPYIYRWIKAVHKRYGHRSDFVGCSLTSDEVVSHDGKFKKLQVNKSEAAFMYKCIGTWGFAPAPHRWANFQSWFHSTHGRVGFHPYVPGIVPTEWYKGFELSGTEDSMWEMWLIYYTYKEKLFTIYNNIRTYSGNPDACLSINRREIGLHMNEKGREDLCSLLTNWRDDFIVFNDDVWKLDWDGNKINKY